jgi:hypothetical protein
VDLESGLKLSYGDFMKMYSEKSSP